MEGFLHSKKFKIALLIFVIILLGVTIGFSFLNPKKDNHEADSDSPGSVASVFSGLFPDKSEPVSEEEKHVEELDKVSEKEDDGEQVIFLPKSEVYSFLMTDSNGIVLNFEKTDAGWVYLDDKDFNLDQNRIEKILNYLCDVRAVEFIENANGDEYGLNAESKSYTLVDGSNNSIIISIGNKDEATGRVYFAINYDFSTVYVNSGKLDKVSEYGVVNLIQR